MIICLEQYCKNQGSGICRHSQVIIHLPDLLYNNEQLTFEEKFSYMNWCVQFEMKEYRDSWSNQKIRFHDEEMDVSIIMSGTNCELKISGNISDKIEEMFYAIWELLFYMMAIFTFRKFMKGMISLKI